MNEWMSEYMNEWMNERMNEWMNEWMNGKYDNGNEIAANICYIYTILYEYVNSKR